jgi:hypothetical protein
VHGLTPTGFAAAVESIMADAPSDAVLSIRVAGALSVQHWRAVSSSRLRALRPSMNVEIVPADRYQQHADPTSPPAVVPRPPQLTLQLS